jgi:hypothetical protein
LIHTFGTLRWWISFSSRHDSSASDAEMALPRSKQYKTVVTGYAPLGIFLESRSRSTSEASVTPILKGHARVAQI